MPRLLAVLRAASFLGVGALEELLAASLATVVEGRPVAALRDAFGLPPDGGFAPAAAARAEERRAWARAAP